jgi:hypothetical protein
MGRYGSVTAHTLRLIKEITRSPEQTALDIYYDTVVY